MTNDINYFAMICGNLLSMEKNRQEVWKSSGRTSWMIKMIIDKKHVGMDKH